jgi:hypothetical protein
MARAWEPEFIRRWQAGATQAAIAEALGVPLGTIKSRAHALAVQGKIQARPRGGAYPSQQAKAHPPGPRPVQTPVQKIDTDAEQRTDTGAVSRVDIGAVHGLDTAAVQRLDQLEVEVQGLTTLVKSLMDRLEHPPGPTPVQISALPPTPRARRCAGICGSWRRFGTRSPPWRPSASCRRASSCRRCCGGG